MPHRYFCQTLQLGEFSLPTTEAQHAVKVMRNSVGDEIEVFDGKGGLASAVITEIDRRNVTVCITDLQQVQPPSKSNIVVAAAPPRGERTKWMVEKLTELGASQFIPLETARSVTYPGQGKLSKLESTVVSACKQCRRLHALEICQPIALSELLKDPSAIFWLGHPEAGPTVSVAESDHEAKHVILIGPEGGFTDDEVAEMRHRDARLLTWPDTILRIETAAIMSLVTVRNLLTARS
ncbi:MAG: RsmE family RNA methyltransferase [Fuerstiella sp.]